MADIAHHSSEFHERRDDSSMLGWDGHPEWLASILG